MDEKKAKWPNYRIAERSKDRASELLKRAQNGMSITDLINALVSDGLDQIENSNPEIPLSPTVVLLRGQLGLKSVQDLDVAGMSMLSEMQSEFQSLKDDLGNVAELRRRIETLEQQISGKPRKS